MARAPHFYSAVFVLLKRGDEYLLQRRLGTGYMDGYYDISASGHVEPGEPAIDAAMRETKEEIGVEVAAEDLKLVMIAQHEVDVSYLNLIYITETWKGEPTILEQDKCDDLQWFTYDELPDELTPVVATMKESEFTDVLHYEFIDEARFSRMLSNKN